MTARANATALLALILLTTAACGGGGGSPTSPTPPTSPTSPVLTTLSGTVAGYAIAAHDYTPTRTGALTATLTWSAAVDLDLYVTAATCTGYPPDACVILARATASSGQREELSLTLTSTTSLKIWVDNFHPTTPAPYSLALSLQ
jgi:hypothetical protein